MEFTLLVGTTIGLRLVGCLSEWRTFFSCFFFVFLLTFELAVFFGFRYAHSFLLIILFIYYVLTALNNEGLGTDIASYSNSPAFFVGMVCYILATILLLTLSVLVHRFLRNIRSFLALEITDAVYTRLEDTFG